jgi:hypothetical protein
MKKLLKKPFLAIIIFFLSPSAFSQTSSNSPLFNCVELAQQIQNRASTTNLPFNGNVEDYANSFIEKIVVAAYVDYISNLFSTAKRDVSQQERESIANQAVDCMRNIKWNFNNPKTSANSAKNESANLAAVALFLGMLESSSGSSNNSSSYTDKTPNRSGSTISSNNSCPTCSQSWTIRDYNEYTKQYSNFRKETKFGFIPCSQCQGTKKMSVTAGSSYIGKVCTLCKGSGWTKCTSGNH